jgi:hypothetical protein
MSNNGSIMTQQLGRPAVNRAQDADAAAIRKMGDGESYKEIADSLGRSKADIYRVCQTLGCASAA